MVSAEAAPWVKVGGLADVVAGLSQSLAEVGHEVVIALPRYGLLESQLDVSESHIVPLHDPLFDKHRVQVTATDCRLTDGRKLYLVGTDRWFRDCRESEEVYVSDPAAYSVFCKACECLCRPGDPDEPFDVVHCHDWHAGLVPVYLCQASRWNPPTVQTVHNMAYTGTFGPDTLQTAGLPEEWFTFDKLEYFGHFSFLKAGMVFATMVNTVSPTYARECETPEFGGGLAGLVRYLAAQGRFTGILNGLDRKVFDPAIDPVLPDHYTADDLSGKAACKAALQRDLGLDEEPSTPVVGMVSRICEQKGHDIVAEAADAIVAAGFQLAILGVGDPVMTESLLRAQRRHPRRIGLRIGFDAYLANRIYAGSDMFLMPSRFEPCGLGQLIAMRYGSIPVVRRTGGLADTVRDLDAHPRIGNGFVFESVTVASILDGLTRALRAYRNGARWQRLQRRAMNEDHSWERVVPEYEKLYERAVSYCGTDG